MLSFSVNGGMSGKRSVAVESCGPGWQGGFPGDRAAEAGTERR